MNFYTRKIRWKFLLFVSASIIGLGSLWYTNQLVKELSIEEQKKIEIWADAMQWMIESTNLDSNSPDYVKIYENNLKILSNNTTIPIIVLEPDGTINQPRNIDSLKISTKKGLEKTIKKMQESYEPIPINLFEGYTQMVYYGKSTLLKRLTYYPYVQLLVIMLFILVAYFAFSSSRKAEQNQVWLGLSKETAHQLGTPISSLMAWYEMLDTDKIQPDAYFELGKDIKRLEKIAERFSKIGSKPKLKYENIISIINNSRNYINSRTSSKVLINFTKPEEKIMVPVNAELFEWVIENLCKNAVDAMNGEGLLEITIKDNTQVLYIDVADNGKGIAKSKFKTIFKPGYTTKKRGWGLGLSLSKRIIEEYHDGRIFVHFSEIDKGTKIRIVLKKFAEF